MRHRRHERHSNEGLILNSLVDIALSLVIGFMVAMPLFFETGIFVSAPGASRAAPTEQGSDIKANIYVTNDGRVLLNEAQVSYENLAELLPRLIARSVERRVVISADTLVIYDQIIRLMDMAKQAGAGDVALLRVRRL